MSLDSIIQECLSFFIWGAQKITKLSITVYENQNLYCLTIQVVGTDSCVIMIPIYCSYLGGCALFFYHGIYMHGQIAIEHNNCLGFEDLYQYKCMQRLDCFTACFIFMIVHDIVVITV